MEKNGQLRVETNSLARTLFFVVMSTSLGLCKVVIKPGEFVIVFFASHVIGRLSFESVDSYEGLGILERLNYSTHHYGPHHSKEKLIQMDPLTHNNRTQN